MDNNADQDYQEYDADFTAVLERVWGEGFMSPGGTDEIDHILSGLDLTDVTIVDIGCGLGGPAVHIAENYKIDQIVAIDIDEGLITQCKQLAKTRNIDQHTDSQLVTPGPLPFADNSIDLVFSKDSIIHIEDKNMLAVDICRILKPGGWFAASDWLAGHDDEPTVEMNAYVEAEGLDYALAGPQKYKNALEHAGFQNIELTSRNEWYRAKAREERSHLKGPLYKELVSKTSCEYVDHMIDIWDKMIVVLDQGELNPTHLRAQKPI